jgi:predicted outer membrane lipoprotein
MSTPWGTGAQTPTHRRSIDGGVSEDSGYPWNNNAVKPHVRPRKRRTGFRGYYLPLALQTALLFGSGVGYGSIVTHLQQSQEITPVPVPGVEGNTISYYFVWGVIGVLLGNALPLVDSLWDEHLSNAPSQQNTRTRRAQTSSDQSGSSLADSDLGPIWYSAVRSIGAFVGIAFAVVSCRAVNVLMQC